MDGAGSSEDEADEDSNIKGKRRTQSKWLKCAKKGGRLVPIISVRFWIALMSSTIPIWEIISP